MSQQLQQLLEQAQTYQQQLQSIAAQRETLKYQEAEIDKALGQLEATAETHVYTMSGPLLIRSPVNEVKKDLLEKKDLIAVRIAALEKGEKRLKDKLEELKHKLTAAHKEGAGG